MTYVTIMDNCICTMQRPREGVCLYLRRERLCLHIEEKDDLPLGAMAQVAINDNCILGRGASVPDWREAEAGRIVGVNYGAAHGSAVKQSRRR